MLEDFSSRAVNRGTTRQEEGPTTNNKYGATTQEDEYFTGYGDISVHKLMLSDEPRMAFYGSVMSNPEYIKGKVVVEVGCGSGVISLWSLLHGQASRVIAIEGSPDMGEMAHAVAEENGARVVAVTDIQYRQLAQSMLRSKSKRAAAIDELLDIQKDICNGGDGSSGVLVLFKGRSTTLINPFDDVTDNGNDDVTIKANIAQELFQTVFLCNAAVAKKEEGKRNGKGSSSSNISAVFRGGVDVLVSEWMGFYLVHESMLPSVIEMREFLSEINSSLSTTTRTDTDGDVVDQFAPVMVPDIANITGAPVSLIPLFKTSQETFWSNIHWKKTSAVGGGVGNSPASSGAAVAPPSLRMNTIGLLQFNAELATCAEKGQPLVEQLPLTATTPSSSPSTAHHHQTLLATPKCIQPLDLQYITLEELMVCGGKVVFNDIGDYQQQHDAGDVAVDGFALWFDVGLSVKARDRLLCGESSLHTTVVPPPSSPSTPHSIPLASVFTLDTSPTAPPTHWKQSVVLLPEEMRTEFKVERRGVGRCSSVVYEMPEAALRVSALKGETVGVSFQIVREDYQGGGDEEEEEEESSAAGGGSRLYTVGFELFDPADEEG